MHSDRTARAPFCNSPRHGETARSRRQFLQEAALSLSALCFGCRGKPKQPPQVSALRSSSYDPRPVDAYSLSGRDLEGLIDKYTGDTPGKPLLLDLLFRIEEDLSAAQVSKEKISGSARNSARNQVIELALRIGAEISEIEKRADRAATTDECIRVFNAALFDDPKPFRFPEPPELLQELNKGLDRTITTTVATHVGVCEDLTVLYLSIADLLDRQGLRMGVAGKRAPGHIFVVWNEDGVEKNIELTARGKSMSNEEYRKQLEVRADLSKTAIQTEKFGGIAGQLYNAAISLSAKGELDTAERYVQLLFKLSPADAYAHLLRASMFLARAKQPHQPQREEFFTAALSCLGKALELDPDCSPAAQLQSGIFVLRSRRSTGSAAAIQLSSAIALLENISDRDLGKRKEWNALFGKWSVPWKKNIGELYLKRAEMLQRSADADTGEAWLKKELGDPLSASWQVEILEARYKATGEKRFLFQALSVLDREIDQRRQEMGPQVNKDFKAQTAFSSKGALLLTLGGYEDAEKCLRSALPRDLSDQFYYAPRDLLRLGCCLARLGKLEEARAAFTAAKKQLQFKNETLHSYFSRHEAAFQDYQEEDWRFERPVLQIIRSDPEAARLFDAA